MGIPTYVINLDSRKDRKAHIEQEFKNLPEFDVKFVSACKHNIGAVSLWKTINRIIDIAIDKDYECILLCEDDHIFTNNYNHHTLKQAITEVKERKGELLLGGISWFEDALQVSDNLFWVQKFSGLQFALIFKSLFWKIKEAQFENHNQADYKISELTTEKYFLFPFISIQKEFGYSDVTLANDNYGRVEELFATTENNLTILKNIRSFYGKLKIPEINLDFETIEIPTYIINLPERTERKEHILRQFENKREFETAIIVAQKHEIGAVGLWQSIRKIIQIAIDREDDVIIICEDDHEFTPSYSKELLIKNIIIANSLGCEYLNTGTGKFGFTVPLSENIYWTNYCLSTQFIVLFKPIFHKILNASFDSTVKADLKLIDLTENKMLLYPFISVQHDFGYSDITDIHNKEQGLVQRMFKLAESRMKTIHKVVNEI